MKSEYKVGQPVIAYDDEDGGETLPVMGYISKVFLDSGDANYVIEWSDSEEDLYPESKVCLYVTEYEKHVKQAKA